MNRAVLAAFLCSAAAPATMCDPTEQMSPFNAAQWPTLSDADRAMPRTMAAPNTTTQGAMPMPEPTVAFLDLPEGEAWGVVKTTVGANVVVLRPNWLPARFRAEKVKIEYAYTNFARYRVGYASEDGLILVAAGAVNSAAPSQSLAIEIGGATVTYSVTSNWPERQVTWIQSDVHYSIQARGVTEDELVQVARGLAEVSVIGTGAEPQPVIVPALPSTSTAAEPELQLGLR